jgi:hypothetical protein
MNKSITQKYTTLLIILLFIGIAVAPSINQSVVKASNENIGKADLVIGKIDLFSGDAPSDNTTWMKIFGGYEYEYGDAVQQTSDGGYIVFGTTSSYGLGSRSAWLIKTDNNGNEEWNKTYGGTGAEAAYDGQQTSDEGYIVVGFTDSNIENPDAWLCKTDVDGNVEWTKRYGGSLTDLGNGVYQTDDGGYIIVGRTNSFGYGDDENIWLLKTDANGNELWNKTFDEERFETGFSVRQTHDNGYIIAGTTDSDTLCDAILIKTDSNGNVEWHRTFGGTGQDGACSVQQTSDNGYIILGSTLSLEFGGFGAWLIRTDSEGNELWNKTYGGSGLGTVQITHDGGYVFTDSVNTVFKEAQLRIVKITKNGFTQWIRVIGTNECEWGSAIQETNDDGFIVVGETDVHGYGVTDILLIKTDKKWEKPGCDE